jgi:hypothetical protein
MRHLGHTLSWQDAQVRDSSQGAWAPQQAQLISGAASSRPTSRPRAGTSDHYFLGRACYKPGQTTPAFKEWFTCAHGVRPAACISAAGGVGTPDPSTTGTSWVSCPTVASEFDAPESAPESASDTSPEQGDDSAGLTPEDPPADVNDTQSPPA